MAFLFVDLFEIKPDDIYEGYKELFRVDRKSTDLSSSMGKLYDDIRSNSFKYTLNELDLDRIDRSHRLVNLLINTRVGEIINVSW